MGTRYPCGGADGRFGGILLIRSDDLDLRLKQEILEFCNQIWEDLRIIYGEKNAKIWSHFTSISERSPHSRRNPERWCKSTFERERVLAGAAMPVVTDKYYKHRIYRQIQINY